MEKAITIILMTVCFTSMVFAYYPGETVIFDNNMGTDNLVYTLVGNSTPIGELNVSINSTNITVTFPGDMPVDNFDIVFFEPIEVEKVVEKVVEKEVEVEVEGDPEYVYKDRKIYVESEPEVITEYIERIVNNTIELNSTSYEANSNNGYTLLQLIATALVTMTIMIVIMTIVTRRKKKKNDIVSDPFRGVTGNVRRWQP